MLFTRNAQPRPALDAVTDGIHRRNFLREAAALGLGALAVPGCGNPFKSAPPAPAAPEPSPIVPADKRLDYIRQLKTDLGKVGLTDLREAERGDDPRSTRPIPLFWTYTLKLGDHEVQIEGDPRLRDFPVRVEALNANKRFPEKPRPGSIASPVYRVTVLPEGGDVADAIFEMSFLQDAVSGKEYSEVPGRRREVPQRKIAEPGSELTVQIYRRLDDLVYAEQKKGFLAFEEIILDLEGRLNKVPKWSRREAEHNTWLTADFEGVRYELHRETVARIRGKYVNQTELWIDSLDPIIGLHYYTAKDVDKIFDAARPKSQPLPAPKGK